MQMVFLTALGIGGATIIGALCGFAFKKISHAFNDIVLAFAAGVMLAAAVIGLILPSLEYSTSFAIPVTVAGIFCGALSLNVLDRIVPHLHRLTGVDQESHPSWPGPACCSDSTGCGDLESGSQCDERDLCTIRNHDDG